MEEPKMRDNADNYLFSGFMKEISDKYGGDPFLFEFFGEIFRWMPIAHLVQKKILVVHGGISASPSLSLDDIARVK